jgi:hypothetical protein
LLDPAAPRRGLAYLLVDRIAMQVKQTLHSHKAMYFRKSEGKCGKKVTVIFRIVW